MDLCDGLLVVSGARGQIAALDHDGHAVWKVIHKSYGGWMVSCDIICPFIRLITN